MKKSVNILNMNIIGNPPFYEAKPEGKKRTAAHLDIKIWDKVCKVFEKHEIVFIMSHGCNQMKNHGYTAISDEEQFPGVGIRICIFERKPGEKPVEIISKYELNGKYDWLREHDMTKVCNHTLWHLIDRDWKKLNKLTEVPEGYLAFQERSGAHINTWLPGEENLSKTSCYVKTNNPEEMQKFFDEKVSPEYEKFIKEFGDMNVDRGFTKTIVVPEGYLAFHERSGAHIDTWLPGEETLLKSKKLSKTSCYVKTNNPEEMQKFFDEKVSPEYEKFIKKFGDKHVDCGFTKTIVVPEELIKEIENEII